MPPTSRAAARRPPLRRRIRSQRTRRRIARPKPRPTRSPKPNPKPRPPPERRIDPSGPARVRAFSFLALKKHFLSGALKKYFITGLLIWIPLVITIWVLKVIFDALDASLLLLPVS